MNTNKKKYGKKNTSIVKNKLVLEEITFRGKKIVRDKVVKEWDIPDIITNDIGFQMMFGFQSVSTLSKAKADRDSVAVDRRFYNEY
tara:strand:- start:188 stop:445 length:258 start_codon:yes stop_codon:yes gene_type:complete